MMFVDGFELDVSSSDVVCLIVYSFGVRLYRFGAVLDILPAHLYIAGFVVHWWIYIVYGILCGFTGALCCVL